MQNTFNQEIDAILREEINPNIRAFVNRKARTWNKVKEGAAESVNTRGAIKIAEVEPNPSNRGYAEGGRYANFGSSKDIRHRIFFVRWSKGRRYSKDALAQLRAGKGIKGFSRHISNDQKDMAREINRQVVQSNGRGDVGVVDTSGVVSSGANGVLQFTSTNGVYFLLKNAEYMLWDPTGLAYRTNGGGSAFTMICTGKTSSTRRATFDTVPNDAADGDILVYADSANRAMHGIPYHVSDAATDYQGQSRAVYEVLRSRVYSNLTNGSPSPLSIALMDRAEGARDFLEDDEDNPSLQWCCSKTQYTAYIRLGDSYQRVINQSGVANLDLGVKNVSHRHTFHVDPDWRDDQMHLLDWSCFGRYVLPGGEPGMLEQEQGGYWREVMNFDTSGNGGYFDQTGYYMGFKMDLGGDMPTRNLALTDLATTGLPTKINSRT